MKRIPLITLFSLTTLTLATHSKAESANFLMQFQGGNADEFGDEYSDEYSDEFGDFYGDADFVSIATGKKKSIDKAPSIASVVTAKDIQNRGARTLSEALAIVPGLNVSRSSQLMAPKFNFRGITSTFGPQTLFMINGVPTTSIVRGDNHTVWGEFPVHSISRIEVIRGPGSALYGADAFAGVINVITKTAEDNNGLNAGIGVGSFDTQNVWLNYGYKGETFSFSGNIEFLKSEGHKEHITADAQTAIDVIANDLFGLSAISEAPGPVNVGFDAVDVHLNLHSGGLNVNLSIQERMDVGTGQGVAEALDSAGKFGGNKTILDAEYVSKELIDGLTLKTKATYYRSSQEIEQNLNLFPDGAFFGAFPDGLIGNPEWTEDRTDFNLVLEYTAFEGHSIVFGTGHSRADLFDVTESKNFFDDLSPRPDGIEDVSNTSEVFIPEASRESTYIYAQDIWQVAPDWELTVGGRYDDFSDFGSTFNPRVALVWSQSLSSTYKLLYGRAFRAPGFAELLTVNNPVALGNEDLSPEIIDTVELSYNYKQGSNLNMSLNAFYYEIEDFITFVADQNGSTATAQNVGQRKGMGLEAETKWGITDDIALQISYSYVEAEDEVVNDDVGDYPNHQLKTNLNWNINEDISFNISAFLVGERKRAVTDSREALSGYTDLSANFRYANIKGWAVDLTFKNLLDDEIFEPSTAPSSLDQLANIPFDLPQAGLAGYLFVSKDF